MKRLLIAYAVFAAFVAFSAIIAGPLGALRSVVLWFTALAIASAVGAWRSRESIAWHVYHDFRIFLMPWKFTACKRCGKWKIKNCGARR